MSCPVLICLPPISASLTYRAYADSIGQQTSALEWILRRLGGSFEPVVLLCATSYEVDRVRRAAPTHTDVEIVSAGSELAACREVLRRRGWHRACVGTLAAGVLPVPLLAAVAAAQEREDLDYTSGAWLPRGAEFACTTQLLLDRVLRLPAGVQPKSLAALREVMGIARVQSINLFRSNFVLLCDPRSAPEELRLDFPEDVELLREFVGPASGVVASGDDLGYLKALLRTRNDAMISSAARPTRPRPPRTRVLFVSDASAFSGAEASLCQTVAALDKSRVEPVAFVSCAGTLSDRLAASGAAVICPQRDFHGTNTDAFHYVHTLLSDVRPDIVHFNSAVPPSILYACVAHSLPLVQHVRVAECDELVPQLKAATGIIAVSQYVKSELAALDIDMNRVHVIHNGVDVQQFVPPSAAERRAARDALGLREADLAVLCIARFSRAKRVDVAVRAVAAARSAVPSIRLFLMGESFPGDVYDGVRALIDELGMADVVTLLGFAEDVRSVLAAVDVLLLTAAREPLSRAVIEAMAMGVPCIVPEDGGLIEVVEDGVTGQKAVPSTPEGFASVLTALLAPDAAVKRHSIGRAARQFVEGHLTARQCAAALENVFESVSSGVL